MGHEDDSRFAEYEIQMAREEYSRQVADKQPREDKSKLRQSMGEFYNDR